MSSAQDDEADQKHARDAFVAEMKSRFEQASASGKSPEEIQELTSTYAREEIRRQIPQVISKAGSWWVGFRRFLIVGTLALALSISLALYVEHHYAAPLCERYATSHRFTYQGIEYPWTGNSSSTSSSGSCIFMDAADHQTTVLLRKVDPNQVASLLASFALQIDFTTPTAFILISLVAVSLFKYK